MGAPNPAHTWQGRGRPKAVAKRAGVGEGNRDRQRRLAVVRRAKGRGEAGKAGSSRGVRVASPEMTVPASSRPSATAWKAHRIPITPSRKLWWDWRIRSDRPRKLPTQTPRQMAVDGAVLQGPRSLAAKLVSRRRGGGSEPGPRITKDATAIKQGDTWPSLQAVRCASIPTARHSPRALSAPEAQRPSITDSQPAPDGPRRPGLAPRPTKKTAATGRVAGDDPRPKDRDVTECLTIAPDGNVKLEGELTCGATAFAPDFARRPLVRRQKPK